MPASEREKYDNELSPFQTETVIGDKRITVGPLKFRRFSVALLILALTIPAYLPGVAVLSAAGISDLGVHYETDNSVTAWGFIFFPLSVLGLFLAMRAFKSMPVFCALAVGINAFAAGAPVIGLIDSGFRSFRGGDWGLTDCWEYQGGIPLLIGYGLFAATALVAVIVDGSRRSAKIS